MKDHYRRGGLGDVKVKKFLNAVMQEELAPIRARRKKKNWRRRFRRSTRSFIKEVLKLKKWQGQTLNEVKDAMKINYF